MIFLACAVLCSSLVAIFMRLSETKRKNNISMLAINYVTCSVFAAVFTGSAGVLVHAEGMGTALFLGLIAGILYLVSFVLLQWNTSVNGVVLSSVFMRLGVLVPTILAITVFRETPGVVQIGGLLLALIAILMIQLEKKGGSVKNAPALLLLLVAGGSAEAMAKIYEQLGTADLKSQYLFFTFFVALLLCVVLAVSKKQKLCAMDVLFGVLIGIPNYFSARFLLLALDSIPAMIAYPTCSVATILVVSAVGVLLFAEWLSKRQMLAMAVILAALVLLNL